MPIVVYGAEGSWVVPEKGAQAAEKPPEPLKPQPVARVTGRRKRAHDPDGHFKADDPTTPDVNEAFAES